MPLSLNLTQKFVAFLLLASVVPLALVGFVAHQVARSTVEEQARRNASELVVQQAEFLNLQLEQIESLIVNISGVEKITQALAGGPVGDGGYSRLSTQAQIGESLGDYSTLRGLVSLDIFTFSGEAYHVGDTLDVEVVPEVRDHIMLNARAEGVGHFWSGFTENVNASSQARQVITVARLITATPRGSSVTRPVAVLMATYDVAHLYQHFSRIDLGAGALLLVADADGRLIYHPDRALIGSRLHRDLTPFLEGPHGTFNVAVDGQELVATYTHLPGHDWVVLSLIPTQTLTAGATTITQAMLLALVFALAFIGIAAVVASRSIVAPLRHLKRRFQLYQSDSPGWQAPLVVSGHDEVAELGRWFNLFTESLVARRKIEEQLRHLAFHDSLTGLPNRKYFLERLEQALARAQSPGAPHAAVLFLDLDRFKNINDSLGHAAGDRVLTLTAARVAGIVRTTDFLARLGGDEFAILLDGLASTEEAAAIAGRVLQSLAVPFEVGGVEVIPQASIGIAVIGGAYRRAEDLLRDADTAMYQAKASGRACSVLFDGAMHQRSIERLRLEADLRRAIERDELIVTYQPIINLATGRLKGFETLVRWQHPERGRVSPADFIPLAEETDLIRQIDLWVLRTACTQLAAWRATWGHDLTVSVNLSARNFQDLRLPEQIMAVLFEAGLPPDAVELEITESAVMADLERTIDILERLSAQGMAIAIDDFGTNYSSLAYLKRLPADTVKIDRSFVSDVTESADSAAIASAIIAMGHILGLTVVAEGVETDAHRAFLTAHRCDAIQGFLISPPVPADEAVKLLRAARLAGPDRGEASTEEPGRRGSPGEAQATAV